jgi:PKD repeat protein
MNNLPKAWFRSVPDTLNLLNIEFFDLSYYESDTWEWNFGDGSVHSFVQNPVHEYPNAGLYSVCLTVSNSNASNTFCRDIQVGTSKINEQEGLQLVRIAPNPFMDKITVNAPATGFTRAAFNLYNQLGEIVLETTLFPDFTEIDTHSLPPGIYFWTVTATRNLVAVGKVIKIGN